MSTLTLSGWTQPADALLGALPGAAIFDYSDYASPEVAIDALGQKFRDVEYVVGWSLGGQLALHAIAAGILQPKHLTLIAVPWEFVGTEGMGPETFTLFRQGYQDAPERSMDRFAGLIAKGDSEERIIRKQFRHHPRANDTGRWLPWLDALAAGRMRQWKFESLPPTLVIHGDGDAIVPFAQSSLLHKHLPNISVSRWMATGHAPHLNNPPLLAREIAEHRAAYFEAQ